MRRDGFKACAVCKERKNHLNHPGDHAFADASSAGMNGVSAARREYLASKEHEDAYAEYRASTQCLAGLAGAPGECFGPLTPHHVAGSGASGGREAAERRGPVIALCAHHNEVIESDPRMRRWAERNYFERGGKEYPFRMRQKARREEVQADA